MTAKQKVTVLMNQLLRQGWGQLVVTVKDHRLAGIEESNSVTRERPHPRRDAHRNAPNRDN
jgi:hypothetical protein